MSTVLVTARSFSSGSLDVARRLRAAGLNVVRGPATHDLDSVRAQLATAVGWIAGTGPVSTIHLEAAPNLRVVARYGVGVDSVDLRAAHARGIVVTNTPGANAAAVADHTIALLLAVLRGVVAGDRQVRAGDWRVGRSRELSALRVGLIGVGRIGRAVAGRLNGFGAATCGIDPFLDDELLRSLGVEPAGSAIPGDVDIVSLHAPGTTCIVDREWVACARSGLILVNAARGTLVDEYAVADGIRSGRLGAYAADTLSAEGETTSPLLAADLAERVVVTPHSAAHTVEAVDLMGSMAVDAVLDVLAGRMPEHVVTEGLSDAR